MLVTDKQEMLTKLKWLAWPMFVIVTLAYMLTLFHRMAPAVMGPILVKELSLDAISFGFMGAVFTWIYAFSQAPLGPTIDRIGPRRSLTFLLVLSAVGCLIFAAATDFTVLVIGRIVLAIAVCAYFIVASKIIAAWFSSSVYPIMNGLLLGLGALGGVFGTTPLQMMMTSLGWRTAIQVIAVISLVIAALAYWKLRDRPADVGLPSPDELVGAVPVVKSNAAPAEEKATLMQVLSMPILWIVGILSLGANGTAQTLMSLWNGVYLNDVYQFSKPVISGILIWSAYGLVVGCVLSGWVARKIGTALTMTLSLTFFLVTWIYLTLNPNTLGVTELKVVNFLIGFLQMSTIATTFPFIKEVLPESRLGTGIGVLNSFAWIFGAGLFQQVWGFVINAVSKGVKPYPVEAFSTIFAVHIGVLALSLLCAIYVLKKYGRNPGEYKEKAASRA